VLPRDPAVTELIVALALGGIGEDLVRLGAFLEAKLSLALVAIGAVGVELHRQAAIGALDLLAVGEFRDAQDFVIVSFGGCHYLFSNRRVSRPSYA